MDQLWQILVQFVFRVTFGVALSMSITPARLVTSGYYRIHLWVLMGLNTFAALILFSGRQSFETSLGSPSIVLGFAIGLGVATYIGAALWLYEKPTPGKIVLHLVTFAGLVAALLATSREHATNVLRTVFEISDIASSGLLLGAILAAMFLGHWYLNTPSMHLLPLKRLVTLMLLAILVRAILCAIGLAADVQQRGELPWLVWGFISLRWLAGLLATLALGILTWQTLKIPNTQSATGILYAAVILAFIGELTSQLLGVDSTFPL